MLKNKQQNFNAYVISILLGFKITTVNFETSNAFVNTHILTYSQLDVTSFDPFYFFFVYLFERGLWLL